MKPWGPPKGSQAGLKPQEDRAGKYGNQYDWGRHSPRHIHGGGTIANGLDYEKNDNKDKLEKEKQKFLRRVADLLKDGLPSLFNDKAGQEEILREILKDAGYEHLLVPLAEPNSPPDEMPPDVNLTLPNEAPELWLERKDRQKTPPDFIREVYKDWLGQGLTQQHIRHLDYSLYQALHKYLTQNKEQRHRILEEIKLPSRKQVNDHRLEAAGLPADPRRLDEQARERMSLHAMARARDERARARKPKSTP